MNLIQLGLDAGILALCCEVVFRQKAEIKAKDFFVFPILLVLCVVPRVDFSIGANMTASFRSEGFEILPADNIVGLLFLIFAVLLLSSIFFGSKSSGTVFCGTMAAFSVFLFVKCLCVVLFAVCGATDILLLLGSRAAALCLIVVLEFTPLFGLIHQLVQRSDFTILIVSTNIAVLLMTVLSILSFDVDRLLANLWIINILILAVLLLDSILLFLHQRRIQEQKRIHMIEQYVPIVEECGDQSAYPLRPDPLPAAQGIGHRPFRKGVHSTLPSRRTGGHTMNQFPSKNYFTIPNEIFSLGLDASEIAVYAYLRCLENRSTYQCWPSYTTIGNAVGRAKNTVMRYADALAEKGLISTEPTSVLTRSGIKKNGNLRYTLRPIREAVEIFHARQLSAVERTTERRQIHRKLSAVNLLPGA